MPFRTRVKVCCIANIKEAQLAIRLGADAIGLVGQMPSGPGIITDEMAHKIATHTPPPISTFLLTCEVTAEAIVEHVTRVGANTVQIVNHIEPAESTKLARLLPGIKRVQVIHVEDESSTDLIDIYTPHNHAFLLDSGRPNAKIAELGGTGRTHDWSISRKIVERSALPVFLAGGLNPDNVGEAIRQVRPYGLDLCSGVRTADKLDEEKLSAFMRNIRDA